MRLKYIIFAVLGLAGLAGGAYNWMSYFKGQSSVPNSVIQALRPPAPPDTANPAGSAAQAKSGTSKAVPVPAPDSTQRTGQVPETVGRDPFLTPDEIAALARGETFEAKPLQPLAVAPGAALPELKLKGLIKDRTTGKYQAIIGQNVYREGDLLGEERIVEITDAWVVLDYSGSRRTVSLEGAGAAKEGGSTIKIKPAP